MVGAQHSTSSFIGAGGVSIFFQSFLPAGTVRQGTIVLAHGLGEHSDRYRHLYHRLLPEGYAFYALDHQGFGRSGGKRGHVARFSDYLQDMKQLVDLARQEQPGWPLVLYGHSMGGVIGLAYALAHPETIEHLVITSPGLANPPRGGLLLVSLAKILSRLTPALTLDSRGGDSSLLTRDPEEIGRADQDPLCHSRVSVRWATEFLAARNRVREQAAALRVSSLLMMQGTGDTVVLPAATQAFFDRVTVADKTLLLYPDYRHELHNDLDREKPLNDLADWLNRHIDKPKDKP